MSNQTSMIKAEEANRAWLQRYIEAVSGEPKTEALMRQFTSDENLIQHVQAFEAAFPSYRILVDDVITEGDKLVVRGRGQGKHAGTFAGISPTGREVEFPVIIIYQLAEEKITQFWMQADMMGLLQQLDEA